MGNGKKLAGALILAFAAGALQAEVAPIATKSGTIDPPPPGEARIVFYRPGSIMGAALGCTIHEGDAQVARLGSGKYFAVDLAPGKHEYNTEGEAHDVLDLDAVAGETHFVRCTIGAGIMAGRAHLTAEDRAIFAAKAKGLTLWKGPGG